MPALVGDGPGESQNLHAGRPVGGRAPVLEPSPDVSQVYYQEAEWEPEAQAGLHPKHPDMETGCPKRQFSPGTTPPAAHLLGMGL